MKKNVIFKLTTILIAVFSLYACDDDFNSVGSEVINGVGFEASSYTTAPLLYNQQLEAVLTSGLPYYQLGTYDDPAYGSTSYNVLAQVLPESFDKKFEEKDSLERVLLSIPYFSTIVNATVDPSTNQNTNVYRLDSVYGNAPIDLSIFRSNYFLRDLDPNATNGGIEFKNRQLYYSDDIQSFGAAVESEKILDKTSFVPSNKEVVIITPDGEDEGTEPDIKKFPPRFTQDLSVKLFKKWIFDKKSSIELSNTNNFLNYFRGIYLKAKPSDGVSGSLLALDFRNADITFFYSSILKANDTSRVNKSFKLNFRNNIINGITNNFKVSIPEPDTINGDESLYLKGGEGSYAVLKLFNRNVETDANGDFVLDKNKNPVFIASSTTENQKTELDFLKSRNWLVNNATLKVYVNNEKMTTQGNQEPQRIYIFNTETGQKLTDFCAINGGISRSHLGVLNKGSDGKGEFYEINITRYIANLLLNDKAKTPKLGLAVTQNFTSEATNEGCVSVNSARSRNNIKIPYSSIISPKGTIIYGNTTGVPENKRLQLEISYSRSINN